MTLPPVQESQKEIPAWKKWFVAIRPFSLPASAMPVLFGTAAAVIVGGAPFRAGLFLLALIGMLMLHGGANILNDIQDFKKGLDTEVSPSMGAVVRGYFPLRTALAGAFILFAAGSAIGLVLAWIRGPMILYIGIAGVLIGVSYTAGPLVLKYRGLGDLAVFVDFGLLVSLGAWIVQTGTFSLTPLLWAVPLSMLIVAILHANNWRDINTDREGGIRTVASSLGDRGSLVYYGFLIFGAPAITILLIALTPLVPPPVPMPWTLSLVLLSLPVALRLWKKALHRHNPSSPHDFVAMDAATGQYCVLFGALCVIALIIQGFFNCFPR